MNAELFNTTILMLEVLLKLYFHNKITLDELENHSRLKITYVIENIDHINTSAALNYANDIVKQYKLII